MNFITAKKGEFILKVYKEVKLERNLNEDLFALLHILIFWESNEIMNDH